MKTVAALIALASFSVITSAAPPAAPSGHGAGGPVDMRKSDAPLTKKGKVLSAVDTKSFTYIEVQDGGKKLWVVSPTIAVKNGNLISYADGPAQAKYHSASLNRDFSNVVFTTRVVIDQ
jgi:hypothetical protein